MKTTSNDISKDRESGITATSILKERGIDSVELIKCTDMHSTCVYLKGLPGLANNFFLHPTKQMGVGLKLNCWF